MSIEAGVLYVVATPLGNLADISYRAVRVLQEVAAIAAEDTRHSRPLLKFYDIRTPMLSLHEHNERARASKLVERLLGGESIALISDAGTPLISDPGYRLVALARAANVRVSPVPGPSALIAALSASGLPTDRFVFEGFLPARSAARERRLRELKSETRTLLFYESSHRVVDALVAMRDVFGGRRRAVVARELTKTFETLHGDSLAGLSCWIEADADQRRGEFVICVEGVQGATNHDALPDTTHLLSVLLTELPVKTAARLASDLTGEKKNKLYQLALNLAGDAGRDPGINSAPKRRTR